MKVVLCSAPKLLSRLWMVLAQREEDKEGWGARGEKEEGKRGGSRESKRGG